MGAAAKRARKQRVFAWVALVGSGIVGTDSVVEGVVSGNVDAIDVWPFVVACYAVGDLLKIRGRERRARTVQAAASMLLAVLALWMGSVGVVDLSLGRGAHWLDLAAGVFGLLHVAFGVVLLVEWTRGRHTPRAV